MTDAIKKAIQDYEKATKAYYTAKAKAEKAAEASKEAWQKFKAGNSIFTAKRENAAEYAEVEKARAAADKASATAKAKNAIMLAMSANVANIAADELKTAIKADPAKFDYPVNYKRFETAVKNVIGENFWIDNRYTFDINFTKGNHSHNNAFITGLTKENKINLESLEKHEPGKHFPTLEEIEAEAKKAAKDAEKIRKIYAEAEKKTNAIQETYNSNIKYFIPYMHIGLKDEYRFF